MKRLTVLAKFWEPAEMLRRRLSRALVSQTEEFHWESVGNREGRVGASAHIGEGPGDFDRALQGERPAPIDDEIGFGRLKDQFRYH